ncbi:uncharacterized protein [Setaria viridis]|uniref:Protein-serine/threonine phosphatase n=1 Tax=Setaria viridis TaxID=4556 RepID=A0A4U6UT97_SETVI|nr:hypothetical protein SEVIR_5G467166v2 [Setaria viridis]
MSNHRTCISDLLISWPVLVSWHLLYRFDPKLDICFSVGKMPECQRGGVDPTRSWKRNEIADDLTGSSTENKTICKREETTGLSISGNLYRDSNQGVWSDLSEEVAKELSKSVVSLALMDGDTVLFACSGIAVDCGEHATRFLTSASLVKALDVERKDHDNLKVQVRHFENVTTRFLGDYDLDQNIATVNVRNFTDMNGVENLHCPRSLRFAMVGHFLLLMGGLPGMNMFLSTKRTFFFLANT